MRKPAFAGTTYGEDYRTGGGPMRLLAAVLAALLVFFSLPASGRAARVFRVAVDIGHTPLDFGTLSARNRMEYDFNLRMARILAGELKKEPRLSVFLVNPRGEEISLDTRADLVNSFRPDLLVSIHHDSVQPEYLSKWTWNGAPAWFCDWFRGYSVFISDKNAEPKRSRSFALALGRSLRAAGFLPSVHHAEMIRGEGKGPVCEELGVFRFDNAVVLKKSRCAAVILECGVIRNRGEETLLRTYAYRLRLARAVRSAISAVLPRPE